MGIDFYDREKLYQEVWAEPVTMVAKRYGVSDVAIKKVCKKLKVPTPGVGYWQQVKAGAELRRPPLTKFNAPVIQHIGNSSDQVKFRNNHLEIKEQLSSKPAPGAIVVPEKLLRPHPLIVEAAAAFKKLWANDREKNPVWHLCGEHLNIRVAKNSADRAFLILDTVLKTLVGEGYTFSYDKRKESTGVLIGGELICFRLHEHVKQVPHIKTAAEIAQEKRYSWNYAPVYDHMPTGELTLSIDYYPYLPRKNWSDGKNHKVEEYIGEFIVGLKIAAAHSKVESERQREELRLRREEEERRRIFLERRDQEREKFAVLEKRAKDWEEAERLAKFVDALEASLSVTLPEAEAKEQSDYIAWARAKIDWLNPVVGRKDDWFGYRKPGG